MTSPLASGTWTLDTTATSVAFTVKNFLVTSVSGTFDATAGSAVTDADGTKIEMSATLDAASFHTGHDKRDRHVRSADFLDVDRHPEITFTSTSVEAVGSDYRVEGVIRAKGNRTPAIFDVTDIRSAGEALTFTASTTVDRNELGITKMPGVMISSTADVTVTGLARPA